MKLSRLALVIVILAMIVVPVVASAADGAAVYKAKCASCHGPDGTGQTGMGKALKLKDLGSADVQKSDIAAVVKDGKGKMPAYKGKISDDEINAVVTFVKSLKK